MVGETWGFLGLLKFCCLSFYIHTLQVLNHMVYINPLSHWGQAVNGNREAGWVWVSGRAQYGAGRIRGVGKWSSWMGGARSYSTAVQLRMSWILTWTELSDTQNCKHTTEIWIFACVLPNFKSWLNEIKYWQESKICLCKQIWCVSPHFMTFGIERLITFSNKDKHGHFSMTLHNLLMHHFNG